MDVLVVGAGGLLGSNVVSAAMSCTGSVSGTYHTAAPSFDVPLDRLDIRNADRFEQIVANRTPDLVVNCAAMTDVDRCESEPSMAAEINAEAPGRLADICARRDVTFVHVSTDYVFDGMANEAYGEDDDTNPRQVYGQTKARGEETVRAALDDYLIVRLSFVWGGHRGRGELSGFPAWVRDQLHAGANVPLFTDQYVTPSRAGAAAEAILALVEQDSSGLFHLTARSCVTPYEFGTALCDRLGADPSLLEPGSLQDIDRPAARPRYTCLDVERVEAELGRPQPTLSEELDEVANLL